MTALPYTITEHIGHRHVAAIFFNGDGSPVESEHKLGRLAPAIFRLLQTLRGACCFVDDDSFATESTLALDGSTACC